MSLEPYYQDNYITEYHGHTLDVLKTFLDNSIQCCVTSPPYWGLRSYCPDQITPKKDAPEWVIKELEKLNIFPIDNTID